VRRDFSPTPIERLAGIDPVRELLYDGLSAPALRAVRSRMVIKMVAHLYETLTDSLTSEPAAYDTFVRTISILSVLPPPEGRRR
jgi:hypothetical protein